MGLHEFMTLVPVGMGFLVWIVIVVYLLFLATRLVRAVEEIARKVGS